MVKIPASGGFLMQEPVEGELRPTEQTEIRIAFDNENLYIAAILYDSNPDGIKLFKKEMHHFAPMTDSCGFSTPL